MPKVILSADYVHKRGSQLSTLLGPIRSDPHDGGPGWGRPTQASKIVFAARDAELNLNYEKWTFSTCHKNFRAGYYEIWMPNNPKKQNEWYLYRAYFHLYRIDSEARELKEYLLLHCDPEEADTLDGRSCYKRVPHLHIKSADEPIPKAHIAMAHGYINDVLSSEGNLFRAMKWGIELIRDEILGRMDNHI